MFHDVIVALWIKPQETISRTEAVIRHSCPASRCVKSKKEERTEPPQILMLVCSFSSLNIKVLRVNPATLPGGQTNL